MNYSKSFEVHTLPDIEMYGGDTLPWIISLIQDDGRTLSFDTASQCAITLSLTPLKTATGYGGYAGMVAPIFTKTAKITEAMNGEAAVIFEFEKNDTIGLRGKFVYQVEVRREDDLRLCQGTLYIKQNINR